MKAPSCFAKGHRGCTMAHFKTVHGLSRSSAILTAIVSVLILPVTVHAQFNYATNYTYITNNGVIVTNGTITITGYTGDTGIAIIPSIINGFPVTSIGNNAFYDAAVSYVTIPNTVTNIGADAFAYSQVNEITIPGSVKSIGNYAFNNCYGLYQLNTPGTTFTAVFENGLTSIGAFAFESGGSFRSIVIPATVTNIGQGAFYSDSQQVFYFEGNAPTIPLSIFSTETPVAYYLPGTTGWTQRFLNESGFTGLAQWYLRSPEILTFEPTFGVKTNQFGFTISWATNIPVSVQACTDLANPVWSSIATDTLVNGSSYFVDTQWTNYSCRFYRISAQ